MILAKAGICSVMMSSCCEAFSCKRGGRDQENCGYYFGVKSMLGKMKCIMMNKEYTKGYIFSPSLVSMV